MLRMSRQPMQSIGVLKNGVTGRGWPPPAILVTGGGSWTLCEHAPGEETRMATFRGSCICGEVAFEVEGPFDLFLNCHCSRCRKASGTAHSCEVIVKAPALRWLRGEASVVRFDLPQARSFATAFCKTCGSPMPHLTRSGREAIVPAGGFDEPLGAAPDRHVHWSSRADWYVHGDGLLVQE
jgi:hypothetical protein